MDQESKGLLLKQIKEGGYLPDAMVDVHKVLANAGWSYTRSCAVTGSRPQDWWMACMCHMVRRHRGSYRWIPRALDCVGRY